MQILKHMGSNIKHPTIALDSKSLETFISSPSYNALEDHRIGYNFAQKIKTTCMGYTSKRITIVYLNSFEKHYKLLCTSCSMLNY
jgi:hypothetical protein